MRQFDDQVADAGLSELRNLWLFESLRDNSVNAAARISLPPVRHVKPAVVAVNNRYRFEQVVPTDQKFRARFVCRSGRGHCHAHLAQHLAMNHARTGIRNEYIFSVVRGKSAAAI